MRLFIFSLPHSSVQPAFYTHAVVNHDAHADPIVAGEARKFVRSSARPTTMWALFNFLLPRRSTEVYQAPLLSGIIAGLLLGRHYDDEALENSTAYPILDSVVPFTPKRRLWTRQVLSVASLVR